jgi:hypothetical protein
MKTLKYYVLLETHAVILPGGKVPIYTREGPYVLRKAAEKALVSESNDSPRPFIVPEADVHKFNTIRDGQPALICSKNMPKDRVNIGPSAIKITQFPNDKISATVKYELPKEMIPKSKLT